MMTNDRAICPEAWQISGSNGILVHVRTRVRRIYGGNERREAGKIEGGARESAYNQGLTHRKHGHYSDRH